MRFTVHGPSFLRSRWRIDAFDLMVLVVFLALSMWTVAVLVAQETPQQLWTGTNGRYLDDQMQYLGWIRDSAEHFLIGNPFQTTESPRDFLNPGLAISGVLVRLGVGAWLSYLMWVPVAAVGLFVAARAYVRRLVARTAKRRCALVLALLYVSPVAALAARIHWNQLLYFQSFALEMWPGQYLWGYPFTAITVALMVGTLIHYERDRLVGRVRPCAPICALLCAWLQPWQGATVVLVVLVSEALLWRRDQRTSIVLPATTVAAAAVPLIYFLLLSHLDASWALSGRINFSQGLPSVDLLVTVLPLGVCAVLAYRGFPMTFQHLAVRIWPIGAFAILRFIQVAHVGTFPKHTLQGLSLPFAALAVIGAGRLRLGLPANARAALGSVLVLVLIGPSVAWELNGARNFDTHTIFGSEPFYINPFEQEALNYLNTTPERGAVLSPVYLGQIVPAETGRKTWVGIISWTPNYQKRTLLANELFSGSLDSAKSVALIRSSHARFLLSDCQRNADLTKLLESVLVSARHFGCATVYQVSS